MVAFREMVSADHSLLPLASFAHRPVAPEFADLRHALATPNAKRRYRARRVVAPQTRRPRVEEVHTDCRRDGSHQTRLCHTVFVSRCKGAPVAPA